LALAPFKLTKTIEDNIPITAMATKSSIKVNDFPFVFNISTFDQLRKWANIDF